MTMEIDGKPISPYIAKRVVESIIEKAIAGVYTHPTPLKCAEIIVVKIGREQDRERMKT